MFLAGLIRKHMEEIEHSVLLFPVSRGYLPQMKTASRGMAGGVALTSALFGGKLETDRHNYISWFI